jgi:enoyl-CoA hydratase/carnithine racemase
MTNQVTRTLEDGVVILSLNRPEKKNALTDEMYEALSDGLGAAQDDPAVRVVLFRANGDAFTAGNDLSSFAHAASGSQASAPSSPARFIRTLASAKKPVVAAVQGRAVGIGLTMLLHCDLVVLSADARLSAPFVDLALVPEAASSLLLTSRIGHVRAFAVFAGGQTVDAPTAVAWGLANMAVAPDQVDGEALAAAKRLASRPPQALLLTRQLMRDVEGILPRLEEELALFGERLVSPEAREAFQAFAEKRAPNFQSTSG